MKLLAINGSPRKGWNTEKLLQKALEGAQAAGAETELVHLNDVVYKGCISCFACKLKNNTTNGLCAYQDDLKPILEKARNADAIIIGSPVYFDSSTALVRAFLERLMFPLDSYEIDTKTGQRKRFLDKTVPTAMIYTMNCPRDMMASVDYPITLGIHESLLSRLFGYSESLYSCDTYQYEDYSKYAIEMFDEQKKAEVRERQFPIDLQSAYELGKRLIEKRRK